MRNKLQTMKGEEMKKKTKIKRENGILIFSCGFFFLRIKGNKKQSGSQQFMCFARGEKEENFFGMFFFEDFPGDDA